MFDQHLVAERLRPDCTVSPPCLSSAPRGQIQKGMQFLKKSDLIKKVKKIFTFLLNNAGDRGNTKERRRTEKEGKPIFLAFLKIKRSV